MPCNHDQFLNFWMIKMGQIVLSYQYCEALVRQCMQNAQYRAWPTWPSIHAASFLFFTNKLMFIGLHRINLAYTCEFNFEFPELLNWGSKNPGWPALLPWPDLQCRTWFSQSALAVYLPGACISKVGCLFSSLGLHERPEDKSPEFMEAPVRWRPDMWFLQVLAPPWANQLSFKQTYYVCHLVPLLCPRWMWDINLRLWNADTDGWQRLIQLQLGQNKQLFEMKLIVKREGVKFLPCCTNRFLFLNGHGSRQVIQKCLWQ